MSLSSSVNVLPYLRLIFSWLPTDPIRISLYFRGISNLKRDPQVWKSPQTPNLCCLQARIWVNLGRGQFVLRRALGRVAGLERRKFTYTLFLFPTIWSFGCQQLELLSNWRLYEI